MAADTGGVRDDSVSIPCSGVTKDGPWLDCEIDPVDHAVRHADFRGRDPGNLYAFNRVKYDLRALPLSAAKTVVFTSEITTTDHGWRTHADTVDISVQLTFTDGTTFTLRNDKGRNPDRGAGPTSHQYTATFQDDSLAKRLVAPSGTSPISFVEVQFHGELVSG